MPTYDVRCPEGYCRLQQLAYACGVVAVFRQEVGTSDSLCTAAWQRTLAHEQVGGPEAVTLWVTAFTRGYRDAQLHHAYRQALGSARHDGEVALAQGASDQETNLSPCSPC